VIKKDLPPGYEDDEPKRGKKKPANKPSSSSAAPTATKQVTTPAPEEPSEVDPQKKLKVLSKKLRQIEDLKQQQASGKTLTKEQLDKIAGEAKIREEMDALNN
jgi:translation initiation factor 2A